MAFRSSLASSMINNLVSYDVVRKILGHTPDAVKHYARVDIERLRDYAIEPPEPSGCFKEFWKSGVMRTFNSLSGKNLKIFYPCDRHHLARVHMLMTVIIFANFDAFSARFTNEKSVSEALINNWIHTLKGKSSSIANEVIVIRIFMKYLNSIGVTAYIPPIPKVADDYVPYIFTDEELERIYLQADNLDVLKYKEESADSGGVSHGHQAHVWLRAPDRRDACLKNEGCRPDWEDFDNEAYKR